MVRSGLRAHHTSPLTEDTRGSQRSQWDDDLRHLQSDTLQRRQREQQHLCSGSTVPSVSASRSSLLARNVFVGQSKAAACNSTAMKKGSSPRIVSRNKNILALPQFSMKNGICAINL
jgi:hypothetical protein